MELRIKKRVWERIQWHNRNTQFSIQKPREHNTNYIDFHMLYAVSALHNGTLFRIPLLSQTVQTNAICHRWPNKKHYALPRHCVNRSV